MWEMCLPAQSLVWKSPATHHNALLALSLCQLLGTASCQRSPAERPPLLEKHAPQGGVTPVVMTCSSSGLQKASEASSSMQGEKEVTLMNAS